MSLEHEFLQVSPERAGALRLDDAAIPYDEVMAPPAGMQVFRLHDDVIGRNLGRIDERRSDDWSGMSLFERGKCAISAGSRQ